MRNTFMLVLVLLAAVALASAVYGVCYIFSHSPREIYPLERKYITNGSDKQYDLPDTIDPKLARPSRVDLSVVIPCYNESERLPRMFEDAIPYLVDNKYAFEIVIVDDQSSDSTAELALKLADEYKLAPHTVKVVKLAKNRGKGGAVTHGVLHSSGKYILFADADGATKFSDVEKLLAYAKSHDETTPVIAIGLRAHMVNTDAVVKRSFIRNLLMYGLHTLVWFFGVQEVQDTQCGFKLFNFTSAKNIFPYMHTERWIFDVEILLLAKFQAMTFKEVPVNWEEIDGSKIDLVKDSINMAIDLVVTRISYLLGIYRMDSNRV